MLAKRFLPALLLLGVCPMLAHGDDALARISPDDLEHLAHLGKEFDEKLRSEPNSRGCELRVLGEVRYDRKKQVIDRFDVAGVGRAWGNKMDYVHREVRLDQYPWMYGIACELVTGDAPQDRIPPYNLLHYRSTGPYFENR